MARKEAKIWTCMGGLDKLVIGVHERFGQTNR
jgi:hypothetical protein